MQLYMFKSLWPVLNQSPGNINRPNIYMNHIYTGSFIFSPITSL